MAIPAELLTGGFLCRLQIAYFTMKMHLIFKQSSQAKKLQNSLVYQLSHSLVYVYVVQYLSSNNQSGIMQLIQFLRNYEAIKLLLTNSTFS